MGIHGGGRFAAGFPANPSGGALCVALECLRQRARLLAADDPRWRSPERFTVSDFWFGDSSVLATCPGAVSEPAVLLRRWRRLEPRVVRPRLIVLLDVPRRRHHAWKPARCACERQFRRADVGPVLRIADPWSPEALDELTAAVRAME